MVSDFRMNVPADIQVKEPRSQSRVGLQSRSPSYSLMNIKKALQNKFIELFEKKRRRPTLPLSQYHRR